MLVLEKLLSVKKRTLRWVNLYYLLSKGFLKKIITEDFRPYKEIVNLWPETNFG